MTPVYRGRFAPTPSGPLHFGSLVAAVASYLEARRAGGQWRLRIDDIDAARVQPDAIAAILRCLEAYGFEWDDAVIYQSQRLAAYHHALHRLQGMGLVYACVCSRSDIARAARAGRDGPIYAGTCKHGRLTKGKVRALRVDLAGAVSAWTDAVQGAQYCDLSEELGDFVLYRAEGVYSFHLAAAVDDAAFGITHIVRGADLLDSSLRQSHLQRLLGFDSPHYAHVPVAVNVHGEKLSKQTGAPALSLPKPISALIRSLRFLGQEPPEELSQANLRTLWSWAFEHWQLARVPRLRYRDDSASLT